MCGFHYLVPYLQARWKTAHLRASTDYRPRKENWDLVDFNTSPFFNVFQLLFSSLS